MRGESGAWAGVEQGSQGGGQPVSVADRVLLCGWARASRRTKYSEGQSAARAVLRHLVLFRFVFKNQTSSGDSSKEKLSLRKTNQHSTWGHPSLLQVCRETGWKEVITFVSIL